MNVENVKILDEIKILEQRVKKSMEKQWKILMKKQLNRILGENK